MSKATTVTFENIKNSFKRIFAGNISVSLNCEITEYIEASLVMYNKHKYKNKNKNSSYKIRWKWGFIRREVHNYDSEKLSSTVKKKMVVGNIIPRT